MPADYYEYCLSTDKAGNIFHVDYCGFLFRFVFNFIVRWASLLEPFLLTCQSAHKLQLKTARWSFSICFLPPLAPFRRRAKHEKHFSEFCFISGFWILLHISLFARFCVMHSNDWQSFAEESVDSETVNVDWEFGWCFLIACGMFIRLAFMQLALSLTVANWLEDIFDLNFNWKSSPLHKRSLSTLRSER